MPAAAAAAQRWRWRRWKWRPRDVVLALLAASVLAPLALYSGAPISPFSGPTLTGRSAFGRDPSNPGARNEMGKRLNLLGQDGVIQQTLDRGSVVDRPNEPSVSKLQNEEVMKGMNSHDSNKGDNADNVVITGNERGAHLGKKSGLGSDGEASEHKAAAVLRDRNASSEKWFNFPGTADRSSEKFTSATSEGSDAKAIRNNNNSHRTNPPDTTMHVIRDQLRRAQTYMGLLPSRGNHGFIRDLRRKMRDIQQALSDATRHRRLPKNVQGKIRAMESVLTKIKQVHENCVSVVDKLLATLHSTEDQVQAHKQRANYLAQVAAKALPKRLHCLALRLTNEYYLSSSYDQHFPYEEKFEDPKLQHYALFSDNVLAASVVVNSTIINSKEPANQVFHIVTDKLNYAGMRMWFLANPPDNAAIQVQNIEAFTWLNSSYSPVLKQLESHFMINYYFKTGQDKTDKNPKFRNPKYLSILNHLRFYLPEIFPKLDKVLFLDDDIVVQQDLSSLWSIDLRGKVNGAVQTCGETFHRFDRYLNFSNPLIEKFDRRACGWAYGMNMFDLSEWRKQNITDVYHYWQKLNANRQLWKLGTLPAGLVTFWNRTFPIDRSWHLLGLGYKPNVNQRDIERAAVIHYNGNLKPWLEIGLPKYRKFWSKYVNFDHLFLRECNINP